MFSLDRPEDHIGGFQALPDRGFETVTYRIAGGQMILMRSPLATARNPELNWNSI
jgi:hypothetical protein